MDKKFEILENETKEISSRKLYRIRALKDFESHGRKIRKGDLGGWVESEENLSQRGNCWVFDQSEVYGNSRVYEDAIIRNDSIIRDNAQIHGNAHISDCDVNDNANIYGDFYANRSSIESNANIRGNFYVDSVYFGKDAYITSLNDFLYINIKGACITFYKTINKKINLHYYDSNEFEFNGSIKQFKKIMNEFPYYEFIKSAIKFAKKFLSSVNSSSNISIIDDEVYGHLE